MSARLSASQLNNYLGCEHHTALWLGEAKRPEQMDASTKLIQDKGNEHEARVLAQLEALHGPALRIAGHEATAEARRHQTVAAIRAGAPLIYQAALYSERWVGFADFLVRKARAPDGTWQYAPEDAKLKFSTSPPA